MFHLVQDTTEAIEANLIRARAYRDSWFSMWFNIVVLVLVVGSFLYFLYASYGTAPSKETTHIQFQANPWMNAVRNVPTTEYGQLPEIEVGGGLSGPLYRTSAAAF
jgi:hypothetical protein